jgi:hypothetical protein
MQALSQLSYSPVERELLRKGNTCALAVARRVEAETLHIRIEHERTFARRSDGIDVPAPLD